MYNAAIYTLLLVDDAYIQSDRKYNKTADIVSEVFSSEVWLTIFILTIGLYLR
jgi:hypothetical protein